MQASDEDTQLWDRDSDDDDLEDNVETNTDTYVSTYISSCVSEILCFRSLPPAQVRGG